MIPPEQASGEDAFDLAGAIDDLQDVDVYQIDEPDAVLKWTLADSICSLAIILGTMAVIHAFLLLAWSRHLNQEYYETVKINAQVITAMSPRARVARSVHVLEGSRGRVAPEPPPQPDLSECDHHPAVPMMKGSEPIRKSTEQSMAKQFQSAAAGAAVLNLTESNVANARGGSGVVHSTVAPPSVPPLLCRPTSTARLSSWISKIVIVGKPRPREHTVTANLSKAAATRKRRESKMPASDSNRDAAIQRIKAYREKERQQQASSKQVAKPQASCRGSSQDRVTLKRIPINSNKRRTGGTAMRHKSSESGVTSAVTGMVSATSSCAEGLGGFAQARLPNLTPSQALPALKALPSSAPLVKGIRQATLLVQENAATLVQSHIRGFLDRKVPNIIAGAAKIDKEACAAAIKLQSACRRRLALRLVNEHRSATRLQACWRSHLSRRGRRAQGSSLPPSPPQAHKDEESQSVSASSCHAATPVAESDATRGRKSDSLSPYERPRKPSLIHNMPSMHGNMLALAEDSVTESGLSTSSFERESKPRRPSIIPNRMRRPSIAPDHMKSFVWGIPPSKEASRKHKRLKKLKKRIIQVQQAQIIRKAVKFRPIPEVLIIPHLEIVLLLALATGQTEAAADMFVASVLTAAATVASLSCSESNSSVANVNSTACEPIEDTLGYSWMFGSILITISLIVWLVWLAKRLIHFYRYHSKRCWVSLRQEAEVELGDSKIANVAEEVVEELEMVKSSIQGLFTVRRAARRIGGYTVPEEHRMEPIRTELALTAAFGICGRKGKEVMDASACIEYTMLASLLDAGNSSKRGTAQGLVSLLLQMATAFVIGGLGRAGEGNAIVAIIQLVLLAVLQISMAVWVLCGDPADRLVAVVSSFVSCCEFTASIFLLCAHLANNILAAQELAERAMLFYTMAVYAPLYLTFYDAVLIPVVSSVIDVVSTGRQEKWSGQRLGREVVVAIVRLPLLVLRELVDVAKESLALREIEDIEGDNDGGLSEPSWLEAWAEKADEKKLEQTGTNGLGTCGSVCFPPKALPPISQTRRPPVTASMPRVATNNKGFSAKQSGRPRAQPMAHRAHVEP